MRLFSKCEEQRNMETEIMKGVVRPLGAVLQLSSINRFTQIYAPHHERVCLFLRAKFLFIHEIPLHSRRIHCHVVNLSQLLEDHPFVHLKRPDKSQNCKISSIISNSCSVFVSFLMSFAFLYPAESDTNS